MAAVGTALGLAAGALATGGVSGNAATARAEAQVGSLAQVRPARVVTARHHARRHHRHHKRHRTRHKVRRHTTAAQRWTGAVDTGSRSAVDAAYRSQFASGLSVATAFTGDVGNCRAGDTSAASRAATLRAINFARSLAGLAPVSFSADLNERAQATALIMSANRKLNHEPPSSWRCWTRTGAANAGRSNLALAYPSLTSAGAVRMYLDEPGSSNTAVGHRRWLLNPFSTVMGSGSTDDANAITVIGPTASARPSPAYVAWPTAGWFPAPLEPDGRWSLSAGNKRTNFSRARVRVFRNGTRVPTTRHKPHKGYAQPTLVWEVPDSVATSGTFHVVVQGIRLGKKKRKHTWSYDVSMFSPSS